MRAVASARADSARYPVWPSLTTVPPMRVPSSALMARLASERCQIMPSRRPRKREPVREHDRERGESGQEELDRLRAAERERGRDESGEPRAVRLVRAAPRQPAVAVERVGVELVPRPLGALVAHVEVAVARERLGRQQVVRLVAGVVRRGERVQPEGGGVGAEEHEPESD